jgi:hypothetical protein
MKKIYKPPALESTFMQLGYAQASQRKKKPLTSMFFFKYIEKD